MVYCLVSDELACISIHTTDQLCEAALDTVTESFHFVHVYSCSTTTFTSGLILSGISNYSALQSSHTYMHSAQILLGLQITPSDDVFVVGESASLTCSSDLDVTTIEWSLDGQVVLSNTGQQDLELTFNVVPDTIHDNGYSCNITSPYGTQEATHRVTAEGRLYGVVNSCTMHIM